MPMRDLRTLDAKTAYLGVLVINQLRRRLRDNDMVAYGVELPFFAKDLGIDCDQLKAMAELDLMPLRMSL